jgi:hypothetical protein
LGIQLRPCAFATSETTNAKSHISNAILMSIHRDYNRGKLRSLLL